MRRFDQRDQALITELVYGVFRQRGFLDWQIDRFSRVKKINFTIRFILRMALYQLLFLDRIPDYAAVDTSVAIAKKKEGIAAGRFVNGLLRNVIRSKAYLPKPSLEPLVSFIAVTTSHPEWMVRRWLARFGEEETMRLCQSNNEVPPMTLRVNRLKTKREKLCNELIEAGGRAKPTGLSQEGLVVKGLSVVSLPAFNRGEFYIQDEGAQLIAYLVDPKPGERILDLCAAPGGKTSHLAELSGGKATIHATDIDSNRLRLLKENLDRLGTPGITVEALSSALSSDRLYDRILIDAPCSALGILRRIPEGKWWKEPSIINTNAVLQLEILESAFTHLKGDGHLVYVTCSTEVEENEEVVAAFSKQHPELVLEDPSSSLPLPARKYVNEQAYFTTQVNSDKIDQFFAVRWIKQ